MPNRLIVLSVAAMAAVVLSSAASLAQEAPPAAAAAGRGARPAPPPSKPTPRWPDGRVNLGAPAGQHGHLGRRRPAGRESEKLRAELDTERTDSHRRDPAPAVGTRARPTRATPKCCASSRTRGASRLAARGNSSRRTALRSSTCRISSASSCSTSEDRTPSARSIWMDGRTPQISDRVTTGIRWGTGRGHAGD